MISPDFVTPYLFNKLYAQVDVDNSGTIDQDEMVVLLKHLLNAEATVTASITYEIDRLW